MCLFEWGLSTFVNIFGIRGGRGEGGWLMYKYKLGLTAQIIIWWELRTYFRQVAVDRILLFFLSVYVVIPRACRKGQVWVRLHV